MASCRLNDQQMAAVERQNEHLLLAAGAGSGKTHVLVERYLSILRNAGWDVALPARLLAITFTEKAAREMKERIIEGMADEARAAAGDPARHRDLTRLRRDMESAPILTIHGFCQRILRENALETGLDPLFTIPSETETAMLEEEVRERLLAVRIPELEFLASRLGRAGLLDSLKQVSDLKRSLALIGEIPRGRALLAELVAQDTLIRQALREHLVRWQGELPDLLDRLCDHYADRVHPLEKGAEQIATAGGLARALADDPPCADALLAVKGALHGLKQKIDGETDTQLVKKLVALRNEIDPAAGDARALDGSAPGEIPSGYSPGDGVPCHEGGRPRGLRMAFAVILDRYQAIFAEEKKRRSWLDFEDLQLRALDLLENNPTVRDRYQNQFQHVMVDEFQDTNQLQMRLVRALLDRTAPTGNRCLFLVGDARQSIYGFRNADVAVFRRLRREMESGGETATLDTNYRSHPEILEFANNMFRGGDFSPLNAGLAEPYAAATGDQPRVGLLLGYERSRAAESDLVMARALADRLRESVESGLPVLHKADPVEFRPLEWGDIVILVRTRTAIGTMTAALAEAGIPYLAGAGRDYFQRQEISDLECLIAALDDPWHPHKLAEGLRSNIIGLSLDDLLLLLPPGGKSGESVISTLGQAAAGESGLSEQGRDRVSLFLDLHLGLSRILYRLPLRRLVSELVRIGNLDLRAAAVSDGQRRLRNLGLLSELLGELEERGPRTVGEFLEFMRWSRDRTPRQEDAWIPEEGESLVRVLTIHSAKGLEFPYVVLADLQRKFNKQDGSGAITTLRADGADGEAMAPVGIRWRNPLDRKMASADTTHRWIRRENERRQTEENDRLLYVAVTRARDYLLLAGYLTGVRSGAEIAAARSGLSRLRPDSFLDRFRDGGGLRDIPLETVVRDPVTLPGIAPGQGGESTEISAEERDKLHHGWSSLFAQPDVETPNLEMAVTSLSLLYNCPRRWLLDHRLGLSGLIDPGGDSWIPTGRGEGGSPGGAGFGTLLHEMMQRWDFRLDPQEAFAAACPAGLDPDLERELREMVVNVLGARFPWPERLSRGGGHRREESFVLDLGGVTLTGQTDLVFEDGGQRFLVDWKSDRLTGKSEITKRVEHHTLQMALYTLALQEAGRPVHQAVLCFFRAEEARGAFRQVDISERNLKWAANKVLTLAEIARELSRLDASTVFGGAERGAEDRIPPPHNPPCRGCPFRDDYCPLPYRRGSLTR